VKLKLDENLSPTLAALFAARGHEAHSVVEQALGGMPDASVIEVCRRERRGLVSLDLDFANILAYPPADHFGIVVLRLHDQAHPTVERAVRRVVELLETEPLVGRLWIVEDSRVRVRG
jgi:predicted nuclease of predicted toxin-antitoxin system